MTEAQRYEALEARMINIEKGIAMLLKGAGKKATALDFGKGAATKATVSRSPRKGLKELCNNAVERRYKRLGIKKPSAAN